MNNARKTAVDSRSDALKALPSDKHSAPSANIDTRVTIHRLTGISPGAIVLRKSNASAAGAPLQSHTRVLEPASKLFSGKIRPPVRKRRAKNVRSDDILDHFQS